MIHPFVLPGLLRARFPEMPQQVAPSQPLLLVFAPVNAFADFTLKAAAMQDDALTGHCLRLAAQLYLRGDRTVRSLIRYSCLPFLTGILPENDLERRKLWALAPPVLRRLWTQGQEQNP